MNSLGSLYKENGTGHLTESIASHALSATYTLPVSPNIAWSAR